MIWWILGIGAAAGCLYLMREKDLGSRSRGRRGAGSTAATSAPPPDAAAPPAAEPADDSDAAQSLAGTAQRSAAIAPSDAAAAAAAANPDRAGETAAETRQGQPAAAGGAPRAAAGESAPATTSAAPARKTAAKKKTTAKKAPAGGRPAGDRPAADAAGEPGTGPRTHKFTLYGTEASINWEPGSSEVRLRAITRFAKGEPQTNSYGDFGYDLQERHWKDGGPRGAARAAEREIIRVTS